MSKHTKNIIDKTLGKTVLSDVSMLTVHFVTTCGFSGSFTIATYYFTNHICILEFLKKIR